jgi:glycosyltransferase involved in cell wall biosynthesis
MSSGIPVLATRVSAVPEVIEDQVTGVLVGSGDARARAEGLLGLARDPGAARGRAGTAGVRERFELDRMVEQTLAVYRDLA